MASSTGGRCVGLLAGVGFDLERVIVLPGDMQAAGNPHDCGRAISLALETGGFVVRGVPRVHNFPRRSVDRHAGRIAFQRRDHAPSIVLRDDGYPVAGEILGRGLACATLGERGNNNKGTKTQSNSTELHLVAARLLYTDSTNRSAVTKLFGETYSVS